jgi:hypothetical protein
MINEKAKKAIKKLAEALTIPENCTSQDIIPHDSVEFGESGGDLLLLFSGGSGETLSTEVIVFRNLQYIWAGTVYSPDTEVVIDGQNPPGVNETIYVLYRATCEGSDCGDGGWRVGVYVDLVEPQ